MNLAGLSANAKLKIILMAGIGVLLPFGGDAPAFWRRREGGPEVKWRDEKTAEGGGCGCVRTPRQNLTNGKILSGRTISSSGFIWAGIMRLFCFGLSARNGVTARLLGNDIVYEVIGRNKVR
jgi:hypothetical protein